MTSGESHLGLGACSVSELTSSTYKYRRGFKATPSLRRNRVPAEAIVERTEVFTTTLGGFRRITKF